MNLTHTIRGDKLRVNSEQLQYIYSVLRLPSKGPWMFESMITARDIMTSPLYTVRPPDQGKESDCPSLHTQI